MTELANITVGRNSIPSLSITVLAMLAIPVVFSFFWRKKHKAQTKLTYLLAGAVGFLVSVRVLELGVHYFCILSDNPVSAFINGSTLAYVLYGTLMAGVFEECGRSIILKYIMKKDRSRENAVLYGIGHGGIEILAVILPAMALYLAIALLFSAGDTQAALRALKLDEETAALALPSIQAAAAFDYPMMALNIIERLLTMLVHIGLTVIVYYGIVCAKKCALPAAVGLHMLVDTLPAIYQRGLIPLALCELWLAVWAVVIFLIARKLYAKLPQGS